ncbi:hypothetical protein [Clostridium carboxidivorans]|uniref:hypothetical protein n=1 Tax=Clostridium carboxidivorans TaxID=217159 RepID=UPI00031ADD32|nr:hypothetical protein [Clostridium carboxidivorans]
MQLYEVAFFYLYKDEYEGDVESPPFLFNIIFEKYVKGDVLNELHNTNGCC